MATEYLGLSYCPFNTNFLEEPVQELVEAVFGIKGSFLTFKLTLKLYSQGYAMKWGDEQCLIFASKLGREYEAAEVKEIVEYLVEKGYFDKEMYQKHQILTSEAIQRVWAEATSRRKRDVSRLKYLMIEIPTSKTKSKVVADVDKTKTEQLTSMKNASILEQSKVKQSRVKQSKVENYPPLPSQAEEYEGEDGEVENDVLKPPVYALNTKTHNYEGLVNNLRKLKITDRKEQLAILKMSNYGEIGHPCWKILAATNWSRINMPGRYLIKMMQTG